MGGGSVQSCGRGGVWSRESMVSGINLCLDWMGGQAGRLEVVRASSSHCNSVGMVDGRKVIGIVF